MTALPELPLQDLARVVAAVRGGTAATAHAGSNVGSHPWSPAGARNGVDVARPRARALFLATATFFASIAIFLHGAHSRAWSVSPTEFSSAEELKMSTKMRLLAAAVGGVVLSGASSAHAQDAVQWRVEDGGNGHWYGISSVVGDWQSVRVWCDARGGHLATCTNSDEWLWLKSSLPVVDCFVGGYQDRTDNEYREPSGGWRWVTGEEFFFDKFIAVDDCPGGVQGVCGCGTPGAQDVLFFTGCCDRILDDIGDGVVQNCDSESRNAVIEWSADCNSDGIVDYGQIRAGELVDTNANNIPDCCEQATSCVPCAADVDESGAVNSVDLAAVLSNWGTDGGKYPRADIDGDGTVSSTDLAAVLSAWGPCE